ncbi:MAG: hypothetical protein N3A66_02845 [Planctomycetota bacterium]|nr:hypothetical protein [Planctomycetota bacterium]
MWQHALLVCQPGALEKLLRLMREKISPLPLDFTIHATNCKILPWHTWCTNILDLEQPYRTDPSRKPRQQPARDGSWMSQSEGVRLPFPPDYTRAMTSGRHIGTISHGMFPLANYNDYRDQVTSKWTEEMALADWAMYQVHEVRSGFYADWRSEWKQWKSFRDALKKAGYGSQKERVINYWQPQPPVAVQSGPEVTWLAVVAPEAEAPPGVLGAILLQSYAEDGTKAAVTWQGAKALVDHRTQKKITESDSASLELPGTFGTALLWAMSDAAAAPPAVE